MKKSLFLIGDSISLHYTPYLQKMLEESYDFERTSHNAGSSKMILKYLTESNIKSYDVMLINCGLHDIRVERETKKIQVNPDNYKLTLEKIVEYVKTKTKKIIWINTTPVIDKIHNEKSENYLRYNKYVIKYNEIAEEIMNRNSIQIIDLYTFTKKLGDNIYEDHVHFKEPIRAIQAAYISGFLTDDE